MGLIEIDRRYRVTEGWNYGRTAKDERQTGRNEGEKQLQRDLYMH